MTRWLLFPLVALVVACARPFAVTPNAPSPPATVVPTTAAHSLQPAATPAPAATRTPVAAAGVRYVAIGASDTVGIGASDPATGSWPARVAAHLLAGGAYVNVGVSGSVASQAKEQQVPAAIAQRPTAISIWLAVNDMNAQVAPATYRGELAGILDALVARTQAAVFVGNVPDIRGVPAYADYDKTQLAALITAYNDAIASAVSAHRGRVFLVDLYTGSAPLVSTMTVSGDGFHPSDDGYRLIADRFIETMRANGVPLT